MGDLVSLSRDEGRTLVVGFVFFTGGFGRGWIGSRSQPLQFLQGGFAAFGNSDLHFSYGGASIGFAHRLGDDCAVVRPYGHWKLVDLRRVGLRTSLPGSIQRDEQRSERVEVVFHRLVELCGRHAVRFLDRFLHRQVLVLDQVKRTACGACLRCRWKYRASW